MKLVAIAFYTSSFCLLFSDAGLLGSFHVSYWYKSPHAMLGELLAKVGVIVQSIFFRQYEVVLSSNFERK